MSPSQFRVHGTGEPEPRTLYPGLFEFIYNFGVFMPVAAKREPNCAARVGTSSFANYLNCWEE